MEKAVLLSTNPFWCDKMCTVIGHDEKFNLIYEKTVEIRKTRPKIETPFKVYIYCTLQGSNKFFQSLKNRFGEYEALSKWNREKWGLKKGKVIGEFMCDEITYLGNVSTDPWCALMGDVHEWHKKLVTKYACLTEEELLKYGGKYAWHISNLVIYDKPRELSEFKTLCTDFYDGKHCDECEYFIDGRGYEYDESDCGCDGLKPLKRPPQSWCYVKEIS